MRSQPKNSCGLGRAECSENNVMVNELRANEGRYYKSRGTVDRVRRICHENRGLVGYALGSLLEGRNDSMAQAAPSQDQKSPSVLT